MANANTPPRSKAPSVTQAVGILRYLAAQPAPSRGVSISRALGISPSSCFNILKVLTTERFVSFDEMKKTYTLGSGAVALARHVLDPANVGYIGREVLRGLADEFDATCTLWRVTSDEGILLVALEASDRTPTLRMHIGQRLPVMVGATGRAIMAASSAPSERLKLKFGELRWEAPPTVEDYLTQIDQARSAGWALDEGAYMRALTTVASAVVDRGCDPQFCVAVTLLGGPHDKAILTQVGQATADAAKRLRLTLFGELNHR
jgi:DNA-binding IclR family transcriptional regulator